MLPPGVHFQNEVCMHQTASSSILNSEVGGWFYLSNLAFWYKLPNFDKMVLFKFGLVVPECIGTPLTQCFMENSGYYLLKCS